VHSFVPVEWKAEEYVLGTRRLFFLRRCYCLCGAAPTGSSRRSGRTVKNLFRHGSQRSDGIPSSRPKNAITPGTCSGEMRCNSRLPQIRQCA